MKKRIFGLCFALLLVVGVSTAFAAENGWYTEGDLQPVKRIAVTLTNPIDVDRQDCPIVVKRTSLPDQNIPELNITIVDPALPPNPRDPTLEEFKSVGAELLRKETNGHYLQYQLDDIDQDGVWDEIFFLTNFKAKETKTIYIYIEYTERGLMAHKTHANIGYYGRHIVPLWEAEYIGWKLFYPTDVDMHGKRTPMLTAYPEYNGNLGGYYMPMEMGTDIMAVGTSFGAGGICLFENVANLDTLSRPRFSPFMDKGPILDTRYSFHVIANGPLRSIIRVKTTNWRTGAGDYELEQTYQAIAHKSYSLCQVEYKKFLPGVSGVQFGCGIRHIMNQNQVYQDGGLVISSGQNVNPYPPMTFAGSSIVAYRDFKVDFEAIAMVVKDKYSPKYRDVAAFTGNHAFSLPVTPDMKYEYMIAGAWSEGKVNNTPDAFKQYVINEAKLYNNPVQLSVGPVEYKK